MVYIYATLTLVIPGNEEQRQSLGRFAKALEHLFCSGIVDAVDKGEVSQLQFCSNLLLLWHSPVMVQTFHGVAELVGSGSSLRVSMSGSTWDLLNNSSLLKCRC